MQGCKRYFSPQASNKRKSHQPYFVDKRLTPRVKEYLAGYEIENQADADEVVDYLQLTFQEYARKKRNSLRQSVEKVLNSLAVPGKKMKFHNESHQDDLLKRSKNPNHSKKFAAKPAEDAFDSQSTDESEDLIEAKDTNMINNSMHLMYKKRNADTSSKAQGNKVSNTESDEVLNNTGQDKNLVSATNAGLLMAVDTGGFELSKRTLDQAKISEASTPAPSPTGSKSGKSDIEKPKLRRKRRDDAEKKQGTQSKKGIKPSESNIKLSDIGGYELALEEVTKLLFHLKHPEVFQRLGVTPPRGFLLHGPPGCGKTLLANAIAGELQLPYYKLAATEIVSGVSGESEEKLRDLFAIAQETSPSIVFLDEIDAVAPNRESASKEMERRIVSQLLVCMDDLDRSDCDVLLIGATNRPDSLDPALRRAGRFDREICLGIPDKSARERILQVVCNGLRLSSSFDYENIAALTPGFVGADLVSLTREAAMFAVKRIFETLRQSEEISSTDANKQADVEKQDTKVGEESTVVQSSVKAETTAETTGAAMPVSTEVATAATSLAAVQTTTAPPTAVSTAAPPTTELSWLKDQPSLTPKQLEEFFIEAEDFKQAVSTVQPSAKREGFATVPDVSWDDIGALEDIRDELSLAILAPVRHAEEFSLLGIANPPGILLAGPPGCGKTLLAKAIANEAGINFISVKGPELLNMLSSVKEIQYGAQSLVWMKKIGRSILEVDVAQ